jgi:hypothetical protein
VSELTMMGPRHCDAVHQDARYDETRLRERRAAFSLSLIRRTAIARNAPIIVGGGETALVNRLLGTGFTDVTRIGVERIQGIGAETTGRSPARRCDLWHDGAVLSSLVDARDRVAYAQVLASAVSIGGWAILGGAAQHDAAGLCALVVGDFQLLETHGEPHDAGAEHALRFHIFQRRRGSRI